MRQEGAEKAGELFMKYLHIIVCIISINGLLEAKASSKKDFGTEPDIEQITIYVPESPTSNQFFARKGFLSRKPKAKANVLIMHGYMCNSKDIGFLRTLFKDYNTATFDFRAHGEATPEQCCTFGKDEALDVMAAVNYIQSQPDLRKLPIIGYGFSMGAVSAIQAESQKPLFDALILDCPFDSSHDILKRAIDTMKLKIFGYEFPLPGRKWLRKNAFNPYVQNVVKVVLKTIAQLDATPINTNIKPVRPVDSIKKVEIPTYFIHCINDEKVPVEAVKKIYENKNGYKRLWITDGRRHFDSFFDDPEGYAFRVNKFIDNVVSRGLGKKVQAKIISTVREESAHSNEHVEGEIKS
jgi:uncharacterized protein